MQERSEEVTTVLRVRLLFSREVEYTSNEGKSANAGSSDDPSCLRGRSIIIIIVSSATTRAPAVAVTPTTAVSFSSAGHDDRCGG